MPLPSPELRCDGAPLSSGFATAAHQLRQRARRTLVYMVVLCSAIAVLLTAIRGQDFGSHLVYAFSVGLACLVVTDATRLAIAAAGDAWRRRRGVPAGPRNDGWTAVIPAVLLATLLGPPAGLELADFITGHRSPSMIRLDSASTRLTLVLSALASLVSVFVLGSLERLARARAQAEAAQRQAAENQLKLLQSQLEPHMLFNTLANLRVLIGVDPARAQAMLDRLITFLRATLNASRHAARPLADEFGHLDDYLALMAVRMGSRLEIALDLPAELRGLPVPPLLLQPLVENAIKHGLEPKVDGGRIEVGARRRDDRLVLEVRDTGVGLASGAAGAGADAGSHFGLELVRSRLATRYGGRARFDLRNAADGRGGVVATVELPLP